MNFKPLTRCRIAVLAFTAWAGAAAAAPNTALIERGRYLTEGIAACGNCHTPQGADGPLPGMAYAGGLEFKEAPFTAYSPNITPDATTGIGRWTDAQVITAIREGRRPDGRVLGPPMPFGLYREMADADVQAIVAYLRTVPAVKNAPPKSEYRMPLPPAWGPPVGQVKGPSPKDTLAWGAYLAGPLGHCLECHSSPGPTGAPDLAQGLGRGGMAFNGPWGTSVAPPITAAAMARYSDTQLKAVITTGVRPDGSRLKPPMGTAYYARMNAADLDALVKYLRSLGQR